MIYATFKSVFATRDYKTFCDLMGIPRGSVRYRTPAENRAAHQFLLAVNTGRRAVFVNFNEDLAVVVEPCFANTRKGRELSRKTTITTTSSYEIAWTRLNDEADRITWGKLQDERVSNLLKEG